MSTEPSGVTKPSKVAITKLLAEAEVARRRSLRPWLLAFLLPLLAGAALIGFSSYEVYVQLQLIKSQGAQIQSQNEQIKANNATIEEQKKAIAAHEEKTQGLEEKTQGLTAAINNVTDPTAKQQIINMIASNPTVAATTPRVFIQVNDDNQRKQADAVALALKSAGFIVPGIEKRADVKVDGNQVKYFRQEDKDAAVKVVAVLAAQGVTSVKTISASGHNVSPGQLEVWFAPAPAPPPANSNVAGVASTGTAKTGDATAGGSTTGASRRGRGRGRGGANANENAKTGGEINSNTGGATGTNTNAGGNTSTSRRRGGRRGGATNSNTTPTPKETQPPPEEKLPANR